MQSSVIELINMGVNHFGTKAFSKQVGVSRQTVHRWQSGKYVPTEDKIESIKRAVAEVPDDTSTQYMKRKRTEPEKLSVVESACKPVYQLVDENED